MVIGYTFAIIFIILHGLVHLLYSGHSMRYFELKPGMTWPDGSWALAGLGGKKTLRILAGVTLIMAAVAFLAGGTGMLLNLAWWQPAAAGAAVFSSILFILFWDGKMRNLDGQGGIGILINVFILAAVLLL